MSEIFLGKDIIENRDSFPDLPAEFFTLIDPDGVNVIEKVQKHEDEYRCICLCKLKSRSQSFDTFITFPPHIYAEIVHAVDISSLGKVN